ncbi:hypothetical protein EZS27_003586 [termite gut metagenome]|uniref:Uncharacterized protein n=1 Tax=termite gut metagenome TaxID=433724 RepID=A0A5J4SS71_9ZZZZ
MILLYYFVTLFFYYFITLYNSMVGFARQRWAMGTDQPHTGTPSNRIIIFPNQKIICNRNPPAERVGLI